jgi:hypothetical protein
MTVPLHLFMKDLLVGAAADHHSIDISSSSVVMDNARIHPVVHVRPPPKQPQRKTAPCDRRQRSNKDIIVASSSSSFSSLDVSDHSKKDSRWNSQEQEKKQQQQQQQKQGEHQHRSRHSYNLDISDHSKKESRWSCTKKEQDVKSPSSSSTTTTITTTSPTSSSSMKLPNRTRSVPKKSKSLDISDHSKRDSRWASLYYHHHHHHPSPPLPENINNKINSNTKTTTSHSLSPVREYRPIIGFKAIFP